MQGLVTVRRQAANPRQEAILDFLIERVEVGASHLHEACQRIRSIRSTTWWSA